MSVFVGVSATPVRWVRMLNQDIKKTNPKYFNKDMFR